MTWPTGDATLHYSATCYIDGRAYEIVDAGWSKRFGLDQDRSSCTVLLKDLIAIQGGEPAYVDVICNNTPRRYFTGFARRDVSSVGSDSGLTYSYQLVDILGALDRAPASAITWTNRSFDDAVTDLLTEAGLSSSQIGPIYDPGSTYDLGTFETITIDVNENLAQVMRELMDFGGTAIWVSPNGVVRVSDYTGIPSANSSISYAWGASGSERPIYDVRQQFGNIDAIVSSFTATGPRRSDNTEPNGTFTASGITGRHEGNTYRFAQSSAVCQAIAEREVIRRARVRQILSLDTQFDPDLMPGRTTHVQVSEFLGINDTAFVEAINSNGHDMTVTYIFGASKVPGEGYSEYPPPYADFSFTIDAELIDVASTLTKQYIVQCDASASYVAQGTISYAWSVSGATATPASPTTVDPCFYIQASALTGVTITLTVSDGVGTPQSVTKALDDPSVQEITRVLSIARTSNGWRVLRDINTGYEDFTRVGQSCDATAKFSANGALLSGWDDGALYAWEPTGGDASLLWTEPAGTGITSIYRNQETAEDILVSADTKLYRSQDDGSTFTLIYTSANTINDVESAPASNYLRVCTGNTVQQSYDGGVTWSAAQTGEAGSVCQQQANAGFGNAACYTGATTDAGLVVFDQGYTVDWSGVTAPSGITTITAQLATEAYTCGDAAGNLYLLTFDGSSTYTASDIGQTDASGTAADLIRDDRLTEMVFGSDSSWKSFKVLNDATILAIDLQPSVQIGIGPLANLSPRFRLLIPTVGLTRGGVYEYRNGTWTLRNGASGSNPLPNTTLYHQAVAVSPSDPDEWLLLTATDSGGTVQVSGGNVVGSDGSTGVLWRTTDGGANWANVPISAASVPTTARLTPVIAWRTSGWAFIVTGPATGFTATGTQVYQGVGTTQGTTASEGSIRAFGLDIMADGTAVVGSQLPQNDDNVWYVDGSGLTRPGSASGEDRDYNNLAAYPTGNRLIAPSIDNNAGNVGRIYATETYNTTQPSLRISASTGTSAVVTTDERVYVGGGPGGFFRTGIAEITDLFGTPSVAVVAASGIDVGRVGIDRQTRTLVAALNSAKGGVYLWDGTEETVIDASSLTAADLIDYVEPIV